MSTVVLGTYTLPCSERSTGTSHPRGFELLLLLTAWKLAYPRHVVLLRGNHESTTCTTFYGFKNEVLAKYGPKEGKVRLPFF